MEACELPIQGKSLDLNNRTNRSTTAAQNKAGKFSKAKQDFANLLAMMDEDSLSFVRIEVRDTATRLTMERTFKALQPE